MLSKHELRFLFRNSRSKLPLVPRPRNIVLLRETPPLRSGLRSEGLSKRTRPPGQRPGLSHAEFVTEAAHAVDDGGADGGDLVGGKGALRRADGQAEGDALGT